MKHFVRRSPTGAKGRNENVGVKNGEHSKSQMSEMPGNPILSRTSELTHPITRLCKEIETCYRNMGLNSFPYTLIYTLTEETLWAVAFVHNSHHQDYWKRNS